MIQFRRILFPTDFSVNSRTAQEFACGLAELHKAELHLLHVAADPILVTADPMSGYAVSMVNSDEVKAGTERELAKLLDPKQTEGLKVVRSVQVGSPVDEVLRYAQEHHIDLIVIGTHGRTGLAHILLGSVAENVVRKSHCPVLTVRHS